MAEVKLIPLEEEDREQFITDNQEAFNYGALQEFGERDDHFEEDGQIISRQTIEESIDGGTAYRIVCDGEKVGGVVVKVEGSRGDLTGSVTVRTQPAAPDKGIRIPEKYRPVLNMVFLLIPDLTAQPVRDLFFAEPSGSTNVFCDLRVSPKFFR